jgi:hypothetical protein
MPPMSDRSLSPASNPVTLQNTVHRLAELTKLAEAQVEAYEKALCRVLWSLCLDVSDPRAYQKHDFKVVDPLFTRLAAFVGTCE